MKLSIIICVYNTSELYLEKCLQSIYDSTLKNTDFEVILVDDGSTIDYSYFIKMYPIEYYKIANSGSFAARIYGTKHAKGEFIAFLDSDDFVSKNYHLPMLDVAMKSRADIVINGWAFKTDRTCRICYEDTSMALHICAEGSEPILLFTKQCGREHSYFVNWNKIYRRELILTTVKQLEQMGLAEYRLVFAEDVLFNFFNFKNANKVVNVNSGFYFYRIHDNQNSKEKNVKQLKEHIDCMSFVFNCMTTNIYNCPERTEIEKNINAWRALMSRSHYQVACSLNCYELFPYIKAKYCVNRLEKPIFKDGSVYTKTELLGENFAEIDCALSQLYLSKQLMNICYEKKCIYVSRIIECTEQWIKVQPYVLEKAEICIPKRCIRMRDRIIHNYIIYRLGMLLFKKGSKSRAFLKKLL